MIEKLKCKNCNKKQEEKLMNIECDNCYILGAIKERKRTITKVRKEIEKLDKARIWNGNDGLNKLKKIINGEDFI